MKKIISLIIITLILFSSLTPALAANEKITKEPVKQDKIVHDMTKESYKSIQSADKSLNIQVKEKDTSKYTVKKDKYKISISKNESKKETTKTTMKIHKKEIEALEGFDGEKFGLPHVANDGTVSHRVVYMKDVLVGDYVETDIELSETIISGFSGYYKVTYPNANLTDWDGTAHASGTLVVSAGVDDGLSVEDGYVPDSCIYASTFDGSSENIVDNGVVAYDYNVTYEDGYLVLNGIDGNVKLSNSAVTQNLSSSSMFVKYVDETGFMDTWRYIWDGGYWSSPYGDTISLGDSFTYVAIMMRNSTGSYTSEAMSYSTTEVFTGYTWDGNNLDYYINSHSSYKTESFFGLLECSVHNGTIGMRNTDRSHANVKVDFIGRFDRDLNSNEIVWMYTGINGTAIRTTNSSWQAFTGGQTTIYNVTTGDDIEILTSYGDVDSVDLTLEYYFTEDITLVEESESDGEVFISINHTAGSNATSGYLEYDVGSSNFTYNLTLDSTNPNATASFHNQTINISTGELSAGENRFYNMTLDSLESFSYTVEWLTKTSTRATFEYNSTNSNVENDFYLEDMSASSTFDFKYSNGTILVNATSDSSGLLKFDDVGGVTDTYKLINDTYTIEKQTSATTFVAVVFAGLSFVGLYFANRFRRR
jgi:hypothetical protein